MSAYIHPRSKLYAHLDRLAQLQHGRTVAPVNVEIDLSNRCSLGCAWCHFAYTHTRGPWASKAEKPDDNLPGGDLMRGNLARRILNELDTAGVRSVTWTGGGEPTLHPEFDSIIEYCAAETMMEQGLYTNGAHLPVRRAGILKDKLTWVYVSLDCADRDEYQRRKGADRFLQVLSGIKHLVEAEGKATIGVGFLVDGDNVANIERMAEFGLSLGVDYVQFRPSIPFDVKAPGVPVGNLDWAKEAAQKLQRIPAYYADKIIADPDRFYMLYTWGGHGYDTCYWSGLQTVITPNGKVWTCVNKRENAAALLGDLTQENFSDIWARYRPACLDDDCRVLCRGHLPNLELERLFVKRAHRNFI